MDGRIPSAKLIQSKGKLKSQEYSYNIYYREFSVVEEHKITLKNSNTNSIAMLKIPSLTSEISLKKPMQKPTLVKPFGGFDEDIGSGILLLGVKGDEMPLETDQGIDQSIKEEIGRAHV